MIDQIIEGRQVFLRIEQVAAQFRQREELLRGSDAELMVELGIGILGKGSYLLDHQIDPRVDFFAEPDNFYGGVREAFGSRLSHGDISLDDAITQISSGDESIIDRAYCTWDVRENPSQTTLALYVQPVTRRGSIFYARWILLKDIVGVVYV